MTLIPAHVAQEYLKGAVNRFTLPNNVVDVLTEAVEQAIAYRTNKCDAFFYVKYGLKPTIKYEGYVIEDVVRHLTERGYKNIEYRSDFIGEEAVVIVSFDF